MIILHSVYSLTIDSREAREKTRMPRLEVITRNWFDWIDEIGKRGSGKEKLNTGYILNHQHLLNH